MFNPTNGMNFMINVFLFLGTAIFWSGSFIAIKYALETIEPISAAAWRVLIGLIFVSSVVKFRRKCIWLPIKRLWKIWLTGIFTIGLPFLLLFWGEKSISAGLAGIINGTVSIWTFIIGIFFLRDIELFTTKKIAGLILGLAGIVLIFSPSIQFDATKSSVIGGIIAVFLMAISYAAGSVMNRRLLSGDSNLDVYVNVFHQLLSSFFFLATVCIIFEGGPAFLPQNASWISIAGCIYMGIFPTGIAWLIFYYLIKKMGAVRATSITYIVPVITLLLDFLFFKKLPETSEIIGMLIVSAGIVLVQSGK